MTTDLSALRPHYLAGLCPTFDGSRFEADVEVHDAHLLVMAWEAGASRESGLAFAITEGLIRDGRADQWFAENVADLRRLMDERTSPPPQA